MAVHVGSGDDMKVWNLPEKLLKSNSTFFTAALEGGFAEGISKIIALPEENPDIFKDFVAWLYVGGNQFAGLDPVSLACLWTLGDRLGCPLMQDDAMCDLIICCSSDYIDEDTLKQTYEGSTRGSKLRQFAVDQCLFDVRNNAPEDDDEWSYPRFVKDNEDFAQEIAKATILLREADPRDPGNDKSPYLYAPSPSTSSTK